MRKGESMEEKNRYYGVIFDLDGTLLDTLRDLQESINAVFEKHGIPARSLDEVRSFVGNGVARLMARCLDGGEEHPAYAMLLQEYRSYYKTHCSNHTCPYQGIPQLLRQLKERGVKTAIVSNKFDGATKELKDVYFPNLIDAAVGENEAAGIRKKPAPDMVYTVIDELHLVKENCLYVGDSEVDIRTAAEAGLPCICVTWGFRDKEELIEAGGTCFADTPEELLQKITGMLYL